MGKVCITVTKYFLFLFNFLFFVFGALIMGFGLWVLLDNQSFIAILPEDESFTELKVGSYIVIGIGAFTMVMGFLGCLGAIYEIRCLLGVYFTLLLLILIAQVVAAVLIFVQRDTLKSKTSSIVTKIVENYQGQNKTAEQAWDYIQRSMNCCGWTGPDDWSKNNVIMNQTLRPCSCRNVSVSRDYIADGIFCDARSSNWTAYSTGCVSSVENWLFTNYGVILGICLGVAVIELLAMILSMGLCKSIHQEEYTKVPKY